MNNHNTTPTPGALAHERELTYVEVGVDEWRRSDGQGLLGTESLDPCIGVAIWDSATGVGHMGHFFAGGTHHTDRGMREFLESVRASTSDPATLKVWVRGGRSSYEGIEFFDTTHEQEDIFMAAARQDALDSLDTIGVTDDTDNLDVRWARQDEAYTDMELDCSNGDFRTVVWPEDAF